MSVSPIVQIVLISDDYHSFHLFGYVYAKQLLRYGTHCDPINQVDQCHIEFVYTVIFGCVN